MAEKSGARFGKYSQVADFSIVKTHSETSLNFMTALMLKCMQTEKNTVRRW